MWEGMGARLFKYAHFARTLRKLLVAEGGGRGAAGWKREGVERRRGSEWVCSPPLESRSADVRNV